MKQTIKTKSYELELCVCPICGSKHTKKLKQNEVKPK